MSMLINLTGIDERLSKHFAHLFIRDPLVIFSETVDQDDESSMDHFEVLSKYIQNNPQPTLLF